MSNRHASFHRLTCGKLLAEVSVISKVNTQVSAFFETYSWPSKILDYTLIACRHDVRLECLIVSASAYYFNCLKLARARPKAKPDSDGARRDDQCLRLMSS